MKMRVLTAGLMLMIAGSAFAQETKPEKAESKATQPAKAEKKQIKSLTVGDKAPPLTIEKWVKGEAVTGFEKGKIYVVEFWATWCGPCIQGMPHLTELQKKYKDKGVTVIGVTRVDPRNSLEQVEKMVKEKGDEKMGYTVAWDKERTTNEAYMVAGDRFGIPCAFVVDQEGRVAWIGHPSSPEEDMDGAIEKMLAGKYDIKAAAKNYEESDERKQAKIQGAQRRGEFDEAIKLIDGEIAAKSENTPQLVLAKFNALALGKKDYDAASAWALEAADKHFSAKNETNATMVNAMAWTILDHKEITKRDYPSALKLAKKAVELSESKDGAILDTLALAQFETGDIAGAIENQKKAIELSKNDPRIDEAGMKEMTDRLEKFEKAAKDKK